MDEKQDILSYQQRKPRIHIFTLDPVLADDIYDRISDDSRTRFYEMVLPKQGQMQQRIEEIEGTAQQTILSRLLIMDVRTVTLPKLKQAYNKIIGYNRKDLNKHCFTILIGDGPLNLFAEGKGLDIFIPHLASHRIDYNPAVFFYDPFIHYEPDEPDALIDEDLKLPTTVPRRLKPFFPEEGVTVDSIRKFFRATEQGEAVKKQRLKTLAALYIKRISEQFPQVIIVEYLVFAGVELIEIDVVGA